jgi:DNA-binding PadR family transcriptional regulator
VTKDHPDSPGQQRHRQPRWRYTTPAVLLLLRDGPAHGYHLLERLPTVFPRAADPPEPGAFYRLMRALEADGTVTSHWDISATGPARRVYTLTDTGREQLEGWSLQITREIDALQRFLDAYRSGPQPPEQTD